LRGLQRLEFRLESKPIPGRRLAVGIILALLSQDQPALFQQRQLVVQRRTAHLAIVRKLRLCRKASKIRVVPVSQVPEHDLRRRWQAALCDRPIGRAMAHAFT
jgi:hypothetical protein